MNFSKKSIAILCIIFSLFIATLTTLNGLNQLVLFAGLVLLPASFFFPYQSLIVLFVCLPIFGNRPASLQALSLMYISTIFLAGSISNLSFIKRPASDANGDSLYLKKASNFSTNKVIFLMFLFFLASVLSISGLPIVDCVRNLPNYIVLNSWSEFIQSLSKLLVVDELQVFYPFVAVINTLLALLIANVTYQLVLFSKDKGLFLLIALFIGLLSSFVFGLLDYYNVIDLRFLRDLDPVVNAGNHQFRIQSFFAHSGWYAEYITTLIPLVILLLLLPIRYALKVGLSLIVMVLGEFILILTYQRGGWLSYPLTLFSVWTAIYLFRIYETGNKADFLKLFRSSFFKIVLSIPITIILSISLINIMSGEEHLISKYTQRFSDISRTNDRTEFIKAGIQIGLLHPFIGGGAESFGYQYEREIAAESGRLYGQYDLPLHGSAHNFYVQTFSGKGLLGLFLLLALIFSSIKDSVKLLQSQQITNNSSRAILLINISFLIAVLIYSNVQEFFYIQILQIIFFSMLAIYGANFQDILPKPNYKFYKTIFCLCVLAHITWEYIYPANNSNFINPEYGCFNAEVSPTGTPFKWCSRNSSIHLPVQYEDGEPYVNLNIKTMYFNSKSATLSLIVNGEVVRQQELKEAATYQEKIAIPNSMVRAEKHLLVTLKTDGYFIPSQVFPNSNDNRILAIQVML